MVKSLSISSWLVPAAFQLLGHPIQRGLKLHDISRHALGHAVERVASVAMGSVQEIKHHGEEPVDFFLAGPGNAFQLLGHPIQRGLKLLDIGRHALGHAVERVASVAMGSVQEIKHHGEEPVDHFLAGPCNASHLVGQPVQRTGKVHIPMAVVHIEQCDRLAHQSD